MKDRYTRQWITDNSIEIVSQYEDGELTIRALHYQLVAIGMTNTLQHYKRVVGAMIASRRDGIIGYSKFSDHRPRGHWRNRMGASQTRSRDKQREASDCPLDGEL